MFGIFLIGFFQHCGPMSSFRIPYRVLWGSLAATLLIVVIGLGVTAHLGLQHKTQVRVNNMSGQFIM